MFGIPNDNMAMGRKGCGSVLAAALGPMVICCFVPAACNDRGKDFEV